MMLEPPDPLVDPPAEIDGSGDDHEPEPPRKWPSWRASKRRLARGAVPVNNLVIVDEAITDIAPWHFSADPNSDLHGCRPEVESLSQRSLDVAQIRLRESSVTEQGERGRIDGPLDGVANSRPGCGMARLKVANGTVQRSSCHSLVIGLGRLKDGGEDLVNTEARRSSNAKYRCRTQERQLLPYSRHDLLALLSGDQVPLIENDDRRTTGDRDPFGESLILVRRPHGRVDDQDRNVSAVE